MNLLELLSIFKHILQYTGLLATKAPLENADKIIQVLNDSPILRDEAYFQLIKQTRNNTNEDSLLKTWHLFLIVATFFPSTNNSQLWIMSHLSDMCRSPIPFVSLYAKFTYIRFSARCSIGKPLDNKVPGYIQKIPSHPEALKQKFGASIYEQLWNQQEDYPNLSFPILIHTLCEELIARDGLSQLGIFRLPGSLKVVRETAEEINKGNLNLSSLQINDIASLIKQWIRDLPDPLIPFARVLDAVTANEDSSFIPFAESLPRAHQLVLKYLVGFLRVVCSFSETNKMTPYNVGVCFGPNVLQTFEKIDQSLVQKYSEIGINFLLALISSWDVSEVYPVNPQFFVR